MLSPFKISCCWERRQTLPSLYCAANRRICNLVRTVSVSYSRKRRTRGGGIILHVKLRERGIGGDKGVGCIPEEVDSLARMFYFGFRNNNFRPICVTQQLCEKREKMLWFHIIIDPSTSRVDGSLHFRLISCFVSN